MSAGLTTAPMRVHPPQEAAVGIRSRPETSVTLTRRQKSYFALLGLGSWLFVRLIGYLTFAEVFLLVTLPVRLRQFMAACTRPGILPLTVLWLLWCASVPITDFVFNTTQLDFFARGMAKAACSGIIIISFYDLIRRNLRVLDWYLPAYAVSHLIGQFIFRDGGSLDMEQKGMSIAGSWEGQINYVVTSFAYAAAAILYRRFPRLTALGVVAIGGINLANGSRSTGAIYVLVGGLLLTVVPVICSRRVANARIYWSKRMDLVKVLVAVAFAAAGTYGLYQAYGHFARSGTFGASAMRKFESQDSVKGGPIVGGRFGFFVAVYAVGQRPIFGHGSWAMDDYNYVERAAQWLDVEVEMPKERRFIPSHSMIMTSWVDHGIAGALFWGYVFVIIVIGLWRVPAVCPEYTAFIWLTSGLFLWALLFSPIHQRMYLAVHVAPMLVVNERYRQRVLASTGLA